MHTQTFLTHFNIWIIHGSKIEKQKQYSIDIMLPSKTNDKQIDINNINLLDRKTYESILMRQLTKAQLSIILHRIKIHLKKQKQAQILTNLNELRKELKAKYSINISNDIIDNFILTTQKVNSQRSQLDFNCIQKEIKSSLSEINKKKYYLNNQNKKVTFTKKILSAQKRKRRNIFNNITTQTMPHIRSMKNFDQMFIRQKLVIFQDYLQEQEISKFQQELQKKIQAIGHLNYGRYAERIKHYTVYDVVLQKVFSLIQEDTKNIEIRTRFQKIYKKMKEEMVSIVTNEEEITNAMKRLKNRSQENLTKNASKNQLKKNYFQLDREKQDLTSQIEETLEGAKKHLKDAFIKRGRPDFAYEMELMLDNRKTPTGPKKIRF